MVRAAQFCKFEASNGTIEIISVGSGDGRIERDIMAAYRLFRGEDLRSNITFIDPAPKYKVDFRTIDDLIVQKPHTVGHCALLIIWPSPDNDGYDIQAIYKLQPHAVFTLYDTTGSSGSFDFCALLHDDDDCIGPGALFTEKVERYRQRKIQLQMEFDYTIEELIDRKLYSWNYVPRLVKLKQQQKIDLPILG